jgi:integrase/recombinase XerD
MTALEARHLSAHTLKTYRDGVTAFLDWCADQGRPPALDQPAVTAFTSWLLGRRAANTAHSRQVAVRRFSRWLARKEIIPADRLAGMENVKTGEPALRPLSDEQLTALFRACKGKEFADVRDMALLRLMAETGLRASEAAALTLPGLDVRARTAVVWRGKGSKGDRRLRRGDSRRDERLPARQAAAQARRPGCAMARPGSARAAL